MENQILIPDLRFQLLSSNFSFWKYQEIQKGDTLVVLKELDLTTKHSHDHARQARMKDGATCVCIASTTVTAQSGADVYYNQAKEELKAMGKIKGFEILNLRSLEKLWISHYDFNGFNK